jgi:hypothetical protein
MAKTVPVYPPFAAFLPRLQGTLFHEKVYYYMRISFAKRCAIANVKGSYDLLHGQVTETLCDAPSVFSSPVE